MSRTEKSYRLGVRISQELKKWLARNKQPLGTQIKIDLEALQYLLDLVREAKKTGASLDLVQEINRLAKLKRI